MHSPAVAARSPGIRSLLGWPRLRSTLLFSIAVGVLLGVRSESGLLLTIGRTAVLGVILMLVFGLFERWPPKLPAWLERWVLQVVAVAVAAPLAAAAIVEITVAANEPPFYDIPEQMSAFAWLAVTALLLAPWTALGALVRQREAMARHQALAFALERSEWERREALGQLRLLRAHVAPHFLFNTLANLQALVEERSPQAPAVLESLVDYLQAAVPRLDDAETTLGDELDLVRAYLELMHMRMPDRLRFALQVDDGVRGLRCPPMTLLTLVENAVRHGIDPSIEGGRIEVHAERRGTRCVLRVTDTGAGLREHDGSGTGLAALEERLRHAFHGDATVRLSALSPRGVSAEVEIPGA
jgi:hypothetical protein